jgi:hypothetical protein
MKTNLMVNAASHYTEPTEKSNPAQMPGFHLLKFRDDVGFWICRDAGDRCDGVAVQVLPALKKTTPAVAGVVRGCCANPDAINAYLLPQGLIAAFSWL